MQLLEKDQEILLTIKRLGINGEGIGYYKRKAVFVEGVIPPEEVIVKITDVKKTYAHGIAQRFKTKAKERIKPFCKHFEECGGCQIQHIRYPEQLLLKEEMLRQAYDRYTSIDFKKTKFNSIVGMNHPRYYRYKSQMPVRNTETGLTTGLYKPESNDLVDILECPVHSEQINKVNQKIVQICDENKVYAFDPETMKGLLRYIVVRQSYLSDEIQVTLVITIFNKVLHKVAKEVGKISDVVSVGISKNYDVKNVEIFGEDVEILYGKEFITEGIGDIRFDLKPKAFYQLNPAQAHKLYKFVKSKLDFKKDKHIIEGYCGAGAISMFLADKAEKIIAIDSSKESIKSAVHNKEVNGFSNISFAKGKMNKVLPVVYNKGFKPDVIIVDPPRSGLDDKTIKNLNKNVVDKLVYISCNPSTLTKNINKLSKKYYVESVTPFDMFPHTSHIESVNILKAK
ncbi:MAG: 23S rRNA (uracil(1939)-C(5))-methyltransferase RlmD [Candidatus Izimaplasma sp.]|nr:23S rRNA (uracil(1939)-C(5))-methyltransferase RlmD [Candidatus Izimaplasma bacterium]